MGIEGIVFKFLGRLKRADLMVLLLIVFLISENRCDRNFRLVLLIIFLSGLEQGVFGS